MTLAGTCVAAGGAGILLRGPSGSGKSDLALRLIHDGCELVSDDRVEISVRGGLLRARAPEATRGLLEVRGVGIFRLPFRPEAGISLVADLVPGGERERLPQPDPCRIGGIAVPRIRVSAASPSAPARVRLAASEAEPVAGALGDAA